MSACCPEIFIYLKNDLSSANESVIQFEFSARLTLFLKFEFWMIFFRSSHLASQYREIDVLELIATSEGPTMSRPPLLLDPTHCFRRLTRTRTYFCFEARLPTLECRRRWDFIKMHLRDLILWLFNRIILRISPFCKRARIPCRNISGKPRVGIVKL